MERLSTLKLFVSSVECKSISSAGRACWHVDHRGVAADPGARGGARRPRLLGRTTRRVMPTEARGAAVPADKERIDRLVPIRDYAYGRRKIDPRLVSAEERSAVPPVRQAMVLDHGPRRKSLHLDSHCASVGGI